MIDVFEIWEPGKSITENKYLEGISYLDGNLIISLKGLNEKDPVLNITFKNHLSFRNTNESFRIKSLYKDKFQNGLNYSNDTSYLRWIKEETNGVYDEINPVHYLIGSNDDITDVISGSAPILTWVHPA
ncbi:hypothetical protein [Mucilaginibacter sp.]|uniref:hypothetical protein n=1 Tax=Mucilaginibacter sp. TaxID=1882438 RepID=UPI002ED68190